MESRLGPYKSLKVMDNEANGYHFCGLYTYRHLLLDSV